MFYNFKDKQLISLDNVRHVHTYVNRPNTIEHWSIKIEYFDGIIIECSVDDYEDALRQIRIIKLLLNKKSCEENL